MKIFHLCLFLPGKDTMQKKVLLNMKKPAVSDEMIQMAKEDQPVEKLKYGHLFYVYQYGRYLAAEEENGILKVSLFLAEHLILDGREPVYSLFIDRKADDFIGYNHLKKQWTSAMIDRLKFLQTAYCSGVYCDDSSTECIQTYLGSDEKAYDAILTFQTELRRRQVLQRYKQKTDLWDAVMEKVPKLPKCWDYWMKKKALTQNFIFYEYNRKGTTQGYCTWCEKDVPVKNPKHNQRGKCSCCGNKIQYKSVKKAQSVITEEETGYLVQRCGDGIVVREFMVHLRVRMASYQKPLILWRERRRFVYDSGWNCTEYYYKYDRTEGKERWQQGELKTIWGPGYPTYIPNVRGCIFTGNLMRLKNTILGRSGFPEYARQEIFADPCEYLAHLRKQPILEQVVKAGLMRVAKEMVDKNKKLAYTPAKELGKALFIDNARLKRLRDANGGMIYLGWLRQEKEQNRVIEEPVIRWMQEKEIRPAELAFISDRMSAVQVKNYLERQSQETGESAKALVTTWKDYLLMAKRLEMDVVDPIVYRARELVRRHDELVRLIGNMDILRQAEEIEKTYPTLPEICKELQKYEYSSSGYKIIAPKRIEDILVEGRELQHCINKGSSYFGRMSSRESYILFLRKKEKENEPYYTLEVEPNGTVRQKRTLFNRQLEDIEQAEEFLKKWQKQLQKKLRAEDFELAKRSRELRSQEMEDLRKNQVRVHGNFQGKLLADLLAEDLMEVAAEDVLAA